MIQSPAPAVVSAPVATHDPPAVLRAPLPEYHAERDLLAAPSFSGVEPRSATGTGSGMRMGDSSHRRRKRPAGPEHSLSSLSVVEEAERTGLSTKIIAAGPAPPPRPKIPRRDGGEGEVQASSPDTSPNAAELADKVVELMEGLFWQSTPVITPSGVSYDHMGPRSVAHEPSPRPAKSSSNQYYLRTLLDSEETKHAGGWVFLNLVLGMAGVHRLNVSLPFIRHSLRTKSDTVELNEQGDKVRWVGPTSRVLNADAPNQSGSAEQAKRDTRARHEREDADVAMAEEERNQVEEEVTSSEGSNSSRRERRGMFRLNSTTTGGPSKDSTNATTASAGQTQSNNSKDKSRSNSGGESGRHTGSQNHNSSSGKHSTTSFSRPAATTLRANLDQVPSYLVSEDRALSNGQPSPPILAGSATMQQPLAYIPLFGHQTSDPATSSADESEAEMDQLTGAASTRFAGDSSSRPAKRRKHNDGGLVFFASDAFCSDLAGDRRTAKVERGQLASEDDVDYVRVSRSNEAGSKRSASGSGSPPLSRTASEVSVMGVEGESVGGESAFFKSLRGWSDADGGEREDWEDGEAVEVGKDAVVLSGMSDAVAADHFAISFKVLHATCPPGAPSFSPRKRPLVPALASVLATRHASDARAPARLRHNLAFDTKIEAHLPAVRVRPPRVRMLARSDDGRAADQGEGANEEDEAVDTLLRVASSPEADYAMSLGMPLYAWAPQGRREQSWDEEDEWGEEKARGGMCE